MLATRSTLSVRMLACALLLTSACARTAVARGPEPPALRLDGASLRIPDVVHVARQAGRVEIDPNALEKMARAHALLIQAAVEGQDVYGLTRGVGLNKDKSIFHESDGRLSEAAKEASYRFNHDALRAHSAAVGHAMPTEQVRAIMLARLNTMLAGYTGAQPQVAKMYAAFLNEGIHPVLPARGSVGEGDITILPHIGLAMIGEWEVDYGGQRVPSREALEAAGIEPLKPFAKDALAILSANAASAGICALMVNDAQHLLSLAHEVFALSLEGLNGNVAPFLEPVQALRAYPGQRAAARRIRASLHGSYLWQASEERALQDPLSFRTASHVLGTAQTTLTQVASVLEVQLNSSDDNPAVIVDLQAERGAGSQVLKYFVQHGPVHGAVIPTSNFNPLPWVIPVQSLGMALSHLSRASVERTIRLGTDHFTGLRRFLAPDDVAIAYGAIQKPFVSLDLENRELANPISMDSLPVAGDIEDTGTNALRAVRRVWTMVDNLYYVLGMELMHAAQAIDLRERKLAKNGGPGLAMGRGTRALFEAYRQHVSFLDRDRVLTVDIGKSYGFLRGHTLRPGGAR